jgi:RNA polymerase sigma-70 factor (ECF subfamily)
LAIVVIKTDAEPHLQVVPLVSDRESDARESRVRRILDEHLDALWRFLRRLGVAPSDIEDALQEVVLILAERLEEIPDAKERAFLFGTAFRVAAESRRWRAGRREVEVEVLAERPDAAPEPDALADRARALEKVDAILASMPLGLRAVFSLYELEELTMIEIAELLRLPQGTVASRLRRARAEFEAQVEDFRAAEHGPAQRRGRS